MTETNQPYNRLQWLPGFSVGITSMIVGYPADTLKVRLQTGMYKSLRSCASKTYSVDGLSGFYRGILTPLITMAFRRSYQYPIFENLKKTNSNYLAGCLAGGSGTLVGCPAHVLKIRMQNSHRKEMSSVWQCGQQIYRRDGFVGFYKGFYANLLKDLTFGCLFLGTYGTLKDKLKKKRANRELLFGKINLDSQFNMIAAGTLAGCVSSLISWTILFPVDTLKTAIQSKKGWDLIRLKQQAGILSFWTGLSPVILRAVPVSLTSMFSYEIITWMIKDDDQNDQDNYK